MARDITNALIWFLVGTAAVGGALFIGLGTWRTYSIIQKNNEVKSTQTSLLMLVQEFQDLLQIARSVSVPSSCTVFVGNLEQPNQYNEVEFRIASASDPSNNTKLQFDTSLLDAGFNIVLAIQNRSDEIAYLSDITEQQSVFRDGSFRIFHVNDATKELRFDLGSYDPETTHVVAFQAKSGIIAYLSDIPIFNTAFSDAEFTVRGVLDPSKRMMFDVSAVSLDTTQVLRVQNVSGTVAYDTDFPWEEGVYNDGAFAIHSANDTDRELVFNLASISTSSLIEMSIQSRSGEVGYLADTSPPVTVDITADRIFPDVGIEGFSTFAEGGIKTVQIWMCGAGGNGAAVCDPSHQPPAGPTIATTFAIGGGAGGGIDGLVIRNVAERYLNFTVGIGQPGSGGAFFSTSINGDHGGSTSITMHPIDSEDQKMVLIGEGGRGGSSFSFVGIWGGFGGDAGWGTFTPSTSSPGVITTSPQPPGRVFGVEGAAGIKSGNIPVDGKIRLPWRGGAHGSYRREHGSICTAEDECTPSSAIGGGYRGAISFSDGPNGVGPGGSHSCNGYLAFGGGGLFGQGGSCFVDPSGDAAPNTCAGGGTPSGPSPGCGSVTAPIFGIGGSGRVMLRYWVI